MAEAYSFAEIAYNLFEQGKYDQAQTIVEGLVISNPYDGYFHGLLGAIIQEGRSIRVDDIGADHRSSPGPNRHPHMHTFLGVPIIHQRDVLGVLVVQQKEHRRFDESEEAFLVTLSAQLAGWRLSASGSISSSELPPPSLHCPQRPPST